MDKQTYLKLIAPAMSMVEKKGQDYNNGGREDLHKYFPFQAKSYAQMVHVKSMRLVSLAQQESTPNYESARDTLLDLINYCVFNLDYLEQQRVITKPV